MPVQLSIRNVSGMSKDCRTSMTHFTNYIECGFDKLTELLSKDCIYSPFSYIGYRRSTESIASTASFVVIDIDHTSISIHERFEQIQAEGLTCILGTTSNITDMYRYRLLMPIDEPVDAVGYRNLVTGLKSNGLITDMDMSSAKPAQMFFSYAGSTVLSYLTGNLLSVSDYSVQPEQIDYSAMDPTELLSTFDTQFGSCSRASQGNRTKTLFGAAFRMKESGMSYEQIVTGVLRINSSFLVNKPVSEIHRRVLNKFK